jgi:uncharacterized membrane protein YvbJ
MTQCQACFTENPPESKFCSKCARKLDEESQQLVVRQRAEYTATGIRWKLVALFAVTVVIVIVLVAVLVFHA